MIRLPLAFLLLCGPAAAQVVTGPAGAAASSNPALLSAALALPSGYTFGKLTTGNPTRLVDLGYTLGSAQAQFNTYSTVVTATTQYVDEVVLAFSVSKATSLFATQGLTCVVLPPSSLFIDQQITIDGGKTCLIGAGTRGSVGTTLFTQTVGTGTAAIRVTGGFLAGRRPLDGLTFAAFNSGIVAMPGAQGGVAAAGGVPSGMTVPSGFYYYTGSIALAIDNASSGQMQDLNFYNYDTPMTYLTANVYIWDFVNFTYQHNNEGININVQPANSFERMRWSGGVAANNNYNVYLAPNGGSGSLFIDNISIDYGTVAEVYYNVGAGSGNDIALPLTMTNNHIETDSTHSGTACRILNYGILFMVGNAGAEEGTFPVGWVCPGQFARETLDGNMIPGTGPGGTYVPAVLSSGSNIYPPTGVGNSQRFGSDVILYQSSAGNQMGGPPTFTSYGNNTSFSLALINQLPLNLLSGAGNTLTIPPDATVNQAVGIPIKFQITDANTWIIGCAGPPTCTGPLVVGGVAGTTFTMTKTAANTWNVVVAGGAAQTGQSSVATPVAPASTAAYKMQGLAGAITPRTTGTILLTISGTCLGNTVTAGDGIQFQLSYGTGAAPVNAATLTGTQVGTIQRCQNPATVIAADVSQPFFVQAVITGLTAGTAYWLDLAAESLTTASSGKLSAVSISAIEVR